MGLTKADKVPRGQRAALQTDAAEALGLPSPEAAIFFSAESGEGTAEIWRAVEETLTSPARSAAGIQGRSGGRRRGRASRRSGFESMAWIRIREGRRILRQDADGAETLGRAQSGQPSAAIGTVPAGEGCRSSQQEVQRLVRCGPVPRSAQEGLDGGGTSRSHGPLVSRGISQMVQRKILYS